MNHFIIKITTTVAFLTLEATVASISVHATDKLFSYTEDSTIVYTSCDSIRLAATLSLPNSRKPVPAVVLISGSGKQNRDGEMAGHAMFKELSDHLSSRGIAVLRSDDRETGKSNGNYLYATTEDFARDATAAVNFLKKHKEIDSGRIGVIGHSEGAAAACIAASSNSDIAFIVSLSGLMCDGLSSVIRQNYDLVEASTMKERDKERYHQIMAIMAQTAYDYADSDSLESQIYRRHDIWKKADDARYKALFFEERDVFRFPVYYYAMEACSKWYRFFIRYNPADYLKNISIPILAINGEKDMMVHTNLNFSTLKRNTEHNPNVTTRVFPGLNHLLLPCEKGTPDEYRSIKAPFSQDVLDTVYQWILEYTK